MLHVRNVCKSYGSGGFWSGKPQKVLHDVSFHLAPGAALGLVGESGSGKSTLGRLILGLERPDSGSITMQGQPLAEWRQRHPGGMSVVFQDYLTSANAMWTLEEIIAEPLLAVGMASRQRGKAVAAMMERVGLPAALGRRLPHEVSGGQLQRVCIARAMVADPAFIVFDEAVSSLDVSVQTRILDMLRALKGDMAYFFIAHDLQAVTYLCDEVLFLHQGRLVEQVATKHMGHMGEAHHAYARRLIGSAILFRSRHTDEEQS